MEGPEHSHSGAGAVPRAPGKWKRRSEVETEIRVLIALPVDELKTRLHQCIAGAAPILEEALIYLIREAIAKTDRALLNLAYEALTRLVTPLLLSHARILPIEERREHPQEVLTRVYAAAKQGGAAIDYAEVNFNDYLKRRSIERLRERNNDFEVVNSRLDPTYESALLENTVSTREPSPECCGLIQMAIVKLPQKLKEVFLQFHYLKLTHAEIARQHGGVTTRTVHNWLAEAKAILGMSGGEHDA
jgi:DNA-directed RNA polymerase specialized sigma24 family protein